MPEINRGQLLRLAVAGAVATVGAGLMAGPAAAALPVPKPQGDDVGFLLFGAVGEMAGADWYERAARVRGFSAGERRRLQQGRAAKADHLRRINAVLGPDAISPGDFAASFPIVTTPNFPTSGKDVRQCCPVPSSGRAGRAGSASRSCSRALSCSRRRRPRRRSPSTAPRR